MVFLLLFPFFFSYENALNVLVHELFHANELEFL